MNKVFPTNVNSVGALNDKHVLVLGNSEDNNKAIGALLESFSSSFVLKAFLGKLSTYTITASNVNPAVPGTFYCSNGGSVILVGTLPTPSEENRNTLIGFGMLNLREDSWGYRYGLWTINGHINGVANATDFTCSIYGDWSFGYMNTYSLFWSNGSSWYSITT